jgi:fatty acid desaturase
MVPYFSWKMSHQHHHMYHAHMDKDTAHVPPRREDVKVHHNEHEDITEDAPLRSIFQLLVHQLLGFQLYFLFFITAGKKSYKQDNKPKWYNQSHLDPWSVAFRADKWRLVVISDLGLLLTFAAIRFAASHIGWQAVMLLYGVPYVWVNHWIVAITLLHHSHPNVPRYEDDAWTFLDGALSTVDRDFGWIGKHVFHNIIDFHVIHHLFPCVFHHVVKINPANLKSGKFHSTML